MLRLEQHPTGRAADREARSDEYVAIRDSDFRLDQEVGRVGGRHVEVHEDLLAYVGLLRSGERHQGDGQGASP